ncbi:IS1182 family transposase [Algoriphagus persicinus]|uniref:IS1182 family transposase n=1 Tax=Algoriphagus persicinus TaxID=3108754 RepID=UPI002B3E31D6|nr:IS1182 family transposase [Algoriphagus sp. E1-3-M2]MEB2787387.1 IS1182 family transposase [Algoriphagus sp. E1-3-M2]
MEKQDLNVVFKDYTPNQLMLLPPSLEELISLNHPGRTVSQIIERIDFTPVYALYSENGSSSYHPKLLLKILVYGYLENCYSSRKLEKAIRENIVYMWLAGMQRPDHHTINRFRSERLREVIGDIFAQVVLLLHEEGLLDIKEVYTDGTKIEANANRYTFVWGKAIKKNKERISAQLKELWDYAGSVASAELGDQEPEFINPSSEKVTQTVEKINRALEGKTVDKKVKQKLNYAKKNWPAKLEEYARKEEVLGERNSYSKTDPDATFMRMKEDHMKNGQLKPAYNLQLSTHGQFVVNYSIHPNPNDTLTLKPHLELYRSRYGFYPSICTADAGYGSEENYSYLEENSVEAFVKYSLFHKELRQESKRNRTYGLLEDLYYDPQKDHYICPIGQTMEASGESTRKTSTGFVQHLRHYRAKNCTGCPLAATCKPGKDGKTLQINRNLHAYKATAKTLLTSTEGIARRKQRATDVEPVFGNLKYNKGMGRYLLRGKEKVNVETGLLVIAHNLAKMAS